MIDIIYSTTKFLTNEKPRIVNNQADKFKTMLFCSEVEGRNRVGGLRVQGYFKNSFDGKPLISVVTIVFNGEKYLEQTILSTLNQTYDNVEYIIIDGGSTDCTVDIIKKYEDSIDYWVSEKDKGISDAFNKGIKLCSGELIGIINADDWYEKNALEIVMKSYCENKHGSVFYGDMRYWFTSTNSIELIPKLKTIKHEMNLFHPSIFVSRSTYKKSGLFDLNYKYAMDYELMLRFFVEGYTFIYVQSIWANMRGGGESHKFVLKSLLEMRKAQLVFLDNNVYIYIKNLLLIIRKLISIVIKKFHLYFLIDIYRWFRK